MLEKWNFKYIIQILSPPILATSDGTLEGSESLSGGLCRSDALRLRIVVLPSLASAQSRPADELTDLAQVGPKNYLFLSYYCAF